MSSEFLISAKIIEFFWFFCTFLMVVYVLLIKFFLKSDIHPITPILQKKYEEKAPQAEDEQQHAMVVNDQAAQNKPPIQNASLPLSVPESLEHNLEAASKNIQEQAQNRMTKLVEDTLPIKIMKFIERLYDIHLPLLSVVILCINQFASYAFATFCVFAYILSVILFHEFEVQKGCDQACAKGLFKFITHLWILCLFINFLVYDEN